MYSKNVSKMIIGSNNSLTYLKPSDALSRITRKFGSCQEIPYNEQYEFYGVRYFDIRLYANKNQRIVAKNGSYTYPLFSFYQILDYFDKKGDVVVNITLDTSFEEHMMDGYQRIEKKFFETCVMLDTIYHNIEFRGGIRKFDGKKLYEFKNIEGLHNIEAVCPEEWSTLYRIVTRWFPSFIGRLNKKYIEEFKDKYVFLVLNYVNRQ
jgi:hypothetical protein